MDIVRKIDEMRVKKGWTFYKLSQESGLSQQTFTKWIAGNTVPSITALESVCNAFNITLAEFFSDGNVVEISPEISAVLSNWKYLSKEQKQTIKSIIDNFVNNK